MQNTQGTIDTESQAKISQSDKLLFCAFLAVAFHAMVLFGVGFKVPDLTSSSVNKTFNVVLAQFEADKKPEKADFIGQANQEGGGDSEDLHTPSAKEMAQFNDPNKSATEPQNTRSSEFKPNSSSEVLTVVGGNLADSTQQEEAKDNKQLPDAAELINRSYELSGLIANLDSKDDNRARKGRKRAVSASIHRASDALYLDTWRRKIERIGNLNYPEKAKTEQIYGNLTLKVALNKDGTINELRITESSGKKLLDDAAIRIVRLAAPFPPLTKEMSKDTDILEIIRVWRFQPDYRLKTN